MSRSKGLALAGSLGLLLLAWACLRSEISLAPTPSPAASPSRAKPLAQAPQAPQPQAQAPTLAEAPTLEPTAEAEPAPSAPPAPPALAEQPRAEAPRALAPEASLPLTRTSWVVPLELGWEDAVVGEPIATEIRFRPVRLHPDDVHFKARIMDAQGGVFGCTVPVRGLIPLDLADGRDSLVEGDQVLLARAPVLLRLSALPFPVSVELYRPDGHLASSLLLEEIDGQVTAQVQ